MEQAAGQAAIGEAALGTVAASAARDVPLALQHAGRLAAIDWMRGLVMVLMAIDHASLFFNGGRVADDSAGMWRAGSALPLDQFLTRWITHLCAPTFLFLAGTSIALSSARRRARGQSEAGTDRDLLIRGALIAGLDLTYMSWLAGNHLFQVLYAIGVSMIAMVGVRRLPDRAIAALALGWFAFGEPITAAVWHPPQSSALPAALTLAQRVDEHTWVFYPFVPWLCIMALGFVFGRSVLLDAGRAAQTPRTLLLLGASCLLVFLLVRGANGWGNMFLLREDGSLAQWLHVSKYPPSLAYVALELGLLALCLAGFFALGTRLGAHPRHPLLVFGQSALFFYLLHFTLLGIASEALGIARAGLGRAYLGALCVCAVLYPVCLAFRRYKQAHPDSWVRFI